MLCIYVPHGPTPQHHQLGPDVEEVIEAQRVAPARQGEHPMARAWDEAVGILYKPTNHNKSIYLVGGFNHLEKYESQWEGLSHTWNGK